MMFLSAMIDMLVGLYDFPDSSGFYQSMARQGINPRRTRAI
jgi:hypothetical protein